jgi:hypothetical protein
VNITALVDARPCVLPRSARAHLHARAHARAHLHARAHARAQDVVRIDPCSAARGWSARERIANPPHGCVGGWQASNREASAASSARWVSALLYGLCSTQPTQRDATQLPLAHAPMHMNARLHAHAPRTGELLYGFFSFYACHVDWNTQVVSVRLGRCDRGICARTL